MSDNEKLLEKENIKSLNDCDGEYQPASIFFDVGVLIIFAIIVIVSENFQAITAFFK